MRSWQSFGSSAFILGALLARPARCVGRFRPDLGIHRFVTIDGYLDALPLYQWGGHAIMVLIPLVRPSSTAYRQSFIADSPKALAAEQRCKHGAPILGERQPITCVPLYQTPDEHCCCRCASDASLRPLGSRSDAKQQHALRHR